MTWTCDACTSINEIDARSRCEVCDTPRPKPAGAPAPQPKPAAAPAPAPAAAPAAGAVPAGAGAGAGAAAAALAAGDGKSDAKAAGAAKAVPAMDYRQAMATHGARQGLSLVGDGDAKDFGALNEMKGAGMGVGLVDPYSDEAIMAQRAAIQSEIARTQPYVSEKEGFAQLEKDVTATPKLLAKVQLVKAKYAGLRRVRGDGSCFYRAYVFGVLEQMLLHRDSPGGGELLQAITKRIASSYDKLIAGGFPALVLDDFYELTYNLFAWCAAKEATVDALRQQFDEKSTNDYVITFLRYLTTYHMRKHSREYTPYLPVGKTLEDFIQSEVQAVDHEVDHLQCMALATELGIGVRIEYTDSSDRPLNGYTLPSNAAPIVHLMYRPGHYDILYVESAGAAISAAAAAAAAAAPKDVPVPSTAAAAGPPAAAPAAAAAAPAKPAGPPMGIVGLPAAAPAAAAEKPK